MAENKTKGEEGCTRCGTFRSAWVVPRKKVDKQQAEAAQWINMLKLALYSVPCLCSVSVLWPLTGPGVSLRPVGLRLTIPAYLWTEERKKLPLVLMLMLLFLLRPGLQFGRLAA